jgi:hypothetical protein
MKNSYILLRNNVESAPLSAEDLQRIGLKANDLLWVECQSVCWQNPHEIPELRILVASANSNEQNKKNTLVAEQPLPATEITEPSPTEKKTVFVQLPAVNETPVNGFAAEKEIVKPVLATTLSEMQQYGGLTDNTDFPFAYKKEPSLKTNYSRSLDDIKEMYLKNLEAKGKQLIELRLSPQTKKITLYTGLVVVGALLMVVIKSFSSDKSSVVKTVSQQQEPATIAAMTMPMDDLETDSVATPESYETATLSAEEATITESINKQPLTATNTKPPVAATKPNKVEEKMEAATTNNGSHEKNTPPVSETKIAKPPSPDDIASQLTLTANNYNVASFGGIRNLKMTLENDSKYLLDKVAVEIQYLNPEGIVLKTDIIIFQSVPSGDKATIAVDKTKRGVKIEYKIVRIDA